jgi:hypothetical protein
VSLYLDASILVALFVIDPSSARAEAFLSMRVAADVDGEALVWAPEGRAARPEPMALPQPLPALRRAEKPAAPAVALAALAAMTFPFCRHCDERSDEAI